MKLKGFGLYRVNCLTGLLSSFVLDDVSAVHLLNLLEIAEDGVVLELLGPEILMVKELILTGLTLSDLPFVHTEDIL